MKRTVVIHAVVALVVISGLLAADDRSDEAEVKRSVQQFEEGLNKRDLSKIEPLVAPDMVAL